MECLLDFMYRGTIDVTEDHLPSLIKIATELEIRGLSAEHQNETANPYSKMQRHNLKVNVQPRSSADNSSATVDLSARDVPSTHHFKTEDIEVEDDPMFIDTHDENFENSLPSTEKHIRNNPSSSCKRETRFKGKKRVAVGRITRSSDFINTRPKSSCVESISSLGDVKLDSRLNSSCSDPTVPEIQMNYDNLLRKKSVDLLTDIEEDVKPFKKKFDIIKRGEINNSIGNSLKIEKKPYKPYSCDLCTLAFTRASHLARHRRVHTGERPFACTLCPRMFARQDKLKQHLDSHLQWPRKRNLQNEPETKLVSVKGKRGRPRKVTVEQSAFEEILKFGEFSSMLNKSQPLNIKNDNGLEECETATDTEEKEMSTSNKVDNCT
ncbi:zinc finger protein 888-like isoform X2 [Belonocnema kinseyi]|nr:zinc finger protein 888-like isoform X2 [Belonocnema kinseyi]